MSSAGALVAGAREQESQLRQQPLDMLVLRVLQMQWGDPDVLLARTIDPPDRSNVAASYQLLRDVGAVVCVGAPLDPVCVPPLWYPYLYAPKTMCFCAQFHSGMSLPALLAY